MDIESANRQSGNWLEGNCPKRCIPCGNPLCADEAMRANQSKRYAPFNAEQAKNHALKTVRNCFSDNQTNFECPLGSNQSEVEKVINRLIKRGE
jgi:hypothetical protein